MSSSIETLLLEWQIIQINKTFEKETGTKVQQEIKCYYYLDTFAHKFLNISVMFKIDILSYGEKHNEYFENKKNAEPCIVFYPQGRQKNVSSIYPDRKVSILIRNDSLISEESKAKNRLVNTLYAERVRSILVEYGKTPSSIYNVSVNSKPDPLPYPWDSF